MSNYDIGGGALSAYTEAQAYPTKMLSMPTMKQRLEAAVVQARENLANAEEAKEILDRNPDIERLLDIIQKGRF